MARTHWYYVVREKSEAGQTGTATYNLPKSGFIPEIIVRAYSTPTAVTDPALPLNKAITKIEITDGAKKIVSLSANAVLGVLLGRVKRTHVSTEINENAVEGYEEFRIVLGGKINGTHYAPDFARFSNPQIKISWDYSITTGPFGATFDADTTPAMKFTVLCKIVKDATKYTHGYIKSYELYTYFNAPNAVTEVEIPRGLPLLGIGIEAGWVNLDWTEDVERLKLDFNTGEWVPLELEEEEIVAFEDSVHGGPAMVSFMMDLIDGVEIDAHMGYPTSVDGVGMSGAGRTFEWLQRHRGVGAPNYMDVATPTAITAYEQVQITSTGYFPYNVLYIPMRALTDDEKDTIDTTKYRDIVLELTAGSAASTSSTPAIIVEYLVTEVPAAE